MNRRALLSSLVVLSLAGGVTACSDSNDGGTKPNQPAAKAGVNDIGATPRDGVKDGGQLIWPIGQFPANFNYLEIDGLTAYTRDVVFSLLPHIYLVDAAGKPNPNPDFLVGTPTLETSPKQKVTFKLNPSAKWNDGKPITFNDFASQWNANNGKNAAYKIASSNGYSSIESVTKGATDQDVIITFAKPYADWQTIFDPILPASTTSDPKVYNEGWVGKIPGPTAGPFKFTSLDKTAQTVTVERDPSWWGDKAKLDKIIYKTVEDDASADALANGEADFMEIGANVNLYKRAKDLGAKFTLRRAGGPNFRHITINGSKPQLTDPKVRQALSMAINRDAIGKALLAPLEVTPSTLNNRIFMTNHGDYKDNAGDVGQYSIEKAKALLETAGWKLDGTTLKKDGKALAIDFVIPAGVAASKSESELIQAMLKEIGVTVNIRVVPVNDLFDKYVTPGQFDMTVFSWIGTPFPVSSSESIYKNPVKDAKGVLQIEQNYARVGTPEIDALFKQGTAELDPAKAAVIGNQIDAALWQIVPNIPMYQRPDLWSVRADLVNFGAFAYADRVYQDIGFKK